MVLSIKANDDKIAELEKTSGQDKNEVKTENQIEEKTDKQKELEEVIQKMKNNLSSTRV